MDKKIEFLKELKDLLIKYNATLVFDYYESFIHGLFDATLTARIDGKEIPLANGYEADASVLIKTLQNYQIKII